MKTSNKANKEISTLHHVWMDNYSAWNREVKKIPDPRDGATDFPKQAHAHLLKKIDYLIGNKNEFEKICQQYMSLSRIDPEGTFIAKISEYKTLLRIKALRDLERFLRKNGRFNGNVIEFFYAGMLSAPLAYPNSTVSVLDGDAGMIESEYGCIPSDHFVKFNQKKPIVNRTGSAYRDYISHIVCSVGSLIPNMIRIVGVVKSTRLPEKYYDLAIAQCDPGLFHHYFNHIFDVVMPGGHIVHLHGYEDIEVFEESFYEIGLYRGLSGEVFSRDMSKKYPSLKKIEVPKELRKLETMSAATYNKESLTMGFVFDIYKKC